MTTHAIRGPTARSIPEQAPTVVAAIALIVAMLTMSHFHDHYAFVPNYAVGLSVIVACAIASCALGLVRRPTDIAPLAVFIGLTIFLMGYTYVSTQITGTFSITASAGSWTIFIAPTVIGSIRQDGLKRFTTVLFWASAAYVAIYTLLALTLIVAPSLVQAQEGDTQLFIYNPLTHGRRVYLMGLFPIFLAGYAASNIAGGKRPLLNAALLTMSVTAILLSVSRSYIVCTVLGIPAMLLYRYQWPRLIIKTLIIISILVTGLLFAGYYEEARQFLLLSSDGSIGARAIRLAIGAQSFKEHPIFGYGFSSNVDAFISDYGRSFFFTDYGAFGILMQFGVVGLFLYAGTTLLMLRGAEVADGDRTVPRALATGLLYAALVEGFYTLVAASTWITDSTILLAVLAGTFLEAAMRAAPKPLQLSPHRRRVSERGAPARPLATSSLARSVPRAPPQ